MALDAARQGNWLQIPRQLVANAGVQLRNIGIGWSALLCLCLALTFLKTRNSFALPSNLKRHLCVYFLCTAAFWMSGSLPFLRLSVTYFPTLIVLLGVIAVGKLARPAAFLLLGPLFQTIEFVVVNLLC